MASMLEEELGSMDAGSGGRKRPRYPRATSSVDKDRQLKKIKREQISEGCEVCNERFVTYTALDTHRENDHPGWNDPMDSRAPPDGVVVHTCEKCRNGYRYRSALVLHSYMHCNYPFICNHCGNGISSKAMLACHKKMHSKIFQCDKCGRMFSGKDSLRKHRKNLTCNGFEDKEYEFHCYTCSASFPSSLQKKEHVKANHMGIVTCEDCGMDFFGAAELAGHVCGETTNHQYCCDSCRRRFITFQQLKNHIVKHKPGDQKNLASSSTAHLARSSLSQFDPRTLKDKDVYPREYRCSECECEKVFKDYYAFQNHMRFHAGYEAFTCSICGKTMSNKASLACHLRAHKNIKPFCCDVCGKKFTEKSKLTRHMRIHTGERPYVCDQCGTSFNQSGSLKNHKRTHEREEDSQTSVQVSRSCPTCRKSFRSLTALGKHKCTELEAPAMAEVKEDLLAQAAMASDALLSLQGDSYTTLGPLEAAPVGQAVVQEVGQAVVEVVPPASIMTLPSHAPPTPSQAVSHVVSLTVSEGVSETVTQAVSQTASQAVSQAVWSMVAQGALGSVTSMLPQYTPEQLTHSLSQFVVQRLSQRMSSVAMEELPRLMSEALEKLIP